MKVVKRSGDIVEFDKEKIVVAVLKAFIDVDKEETQYAKEKAREIANYVAGLGKDMGVEEIQDIVVAKLMASKRKDVATRYVEHRYKHKLIREVNTTDDTIMELLNGASSYWNEENSNKNPRLTTTQRDYMAGIVSTDITKRVLLPQDIVDAHESGIIHFHDADYFIQYAHNCDLLNLEDMLQNGTVISGTMIEKPHRFLTACNIATQIIAQVASSQYGGQSISLTHLAPFVEDSRRIIRAEVEQECSDPSRINEIVERRVRNEIKSGIQTIQYQLITLMTTNGQAPFLTIFLYLGEAKNEREKADLAIMIEETLNQRIEGVKNEVGVWISPAFPKLIYVLEEDNISEDSKYWYLTELAAKCTAKRLVPDYISAKKMLEYKGDVYTCINKTCA